MDNVTAWMSFLTVPLVQKSSQMVNSFNRSILIDSKCSLNNHRNKMESNATSVHPYLTLPEH
jgi:hypothetical protein